MQFIFLKDVLVSYIEEAMVGSQGITLNCIFLQPPDSHRLEPPDSNLYPKYDPSHISRDLRRISEIGNGKFHWSFESGKYLYCDFFCEKII